MGMKEMQEKKGKDNMPSTLNEFLEKALKDQPKVNEAKKLNLSSEDEKLLKRAIALAIDQEGSPYITSKDAKGLQKILDKLG
jgi:hypothetical protein